MIFSLLIHYTTTIILLMIIPLYDIPIIFPF